MRINPPRRALGGLALIGLAAYGGFAYAQQLTFRSLSGNEVVLAQLGGPGGTSIFVPTSQMRNSQGVSVTAATTGTLTFTLSTASLVFTAASGGAQTINLPPTPWDGQIFEIINGSAAAFTTGSVVATTDGSSIAGGATPTALSTLAAGTSTEWRYSQTNNTWYRMR